MTVIKCPECGKEIMIKAVVKASGGQFGGSAFFCSECNKEIPDHVKEWSERNLGVALCYDCQKIAKEKQ